jgi:magnesium transporter
VQVLTEVSDGVRELRSSGEFFWLDLTRPSESELRHAAALVGLDRRALEQTQHWHQRPQLREYDEQLCLVFYGAEPGEHPVPVETHVHVSGGWVVTVRREGSGALDGLRSDLGAAQPIPEELVVARILSALAESFNDLLDPLYERLDRIGSTAAAAEESGVPTRETRLQILGQRGWLLRLLRIVRRQRDYLDQAVDDLQRLPGLEPGAEHELRNVVSQMVRVSDRIDDALRSLDDALDLLNAALSNRLNVVMERLTVVATVFLPLTVVTSFFGMNFSWMVKRIDSLAAFLVLGIGVFALSGVAIYLWVRSRLERHPLG